MISMKSEKPTTSLRITYSIILLFLCGPVANAFVPPFSPRKNSIAYIPTTSTSASTTWHGVPAKKQKTTEKHNEINMLPMGGDDGFGMGGLMTRSQLLSNPIAYTVGFTGAFRTGAAISVINQPQMPEITSQVNVGSTVWRLPSGARVRLFYPTTQTKIADGKTIIAPYCTDGRQTSDGMAGLVGFRQTGLSFLLAHLAEASSGCIQDAPIDATSFEDEDLPLLIYSHGYGGNMDMATYFFRTMASKGVIIAAVEHTDGTASSTILADGREQKFDQYFMTGRQQLTRRASELLEAVDYLPKEIKNKYPTASKLTTIMLGGHSYGCPSAIMAANGVSENTKIDGLILHDPALGMGYGMLPPNGSTSTIKTISYISDEYNRANTRYGDLTLHVKGCYHGNFVDAPLWAPRFVMRLLSLAIPAAGPAQPMEIHDQLAESAIAFMKTKNPLSPTVMMGDLFEFIR